jgi:hypothetical protein
VSDANKMDTYLANFSNDYNDIIDNLKADETFIETGVTLSSQPLIIDFLNNYSVTGLHALASLIDDGKISTACGGELLRQLGEIRAEGIEPLILNTISNYIDHPSPKIRDGAVTGLLNTENPEAIPIIEHALTYEPDAFIDKIMRQALKSLKVKNLPEKSIKEVDLSGSRKPEDVINLSIPRDEKGNSIPLSRAELREAEMEIPIKFPKGTLTNAEFATLQAAGEQLARIILNQLGNPMAVHVSSMIDIQKDEFERTKSFVIRLTGVLTLSKDPKYNPADPFQRNEDEDLNNISPSESEIY